MSRKFVRSLAIKSSNKMDCVGQGMMWFLIGSGHYALGLFLVVAYLSISMVLEELVRKWDRLEAPRVDSYTDAQAWAEWNATVDKAMA